MSFDAAWLALREPHDFRARSRRLRDAAVSWLENEPAAEITDLGAGTGATYRYLAPHLSYEARWTFVDRDPDTLDFATSSTGARGLNLDLARDLPPLGDLVTTSAFFDLVSTDWIERFVDALDGRPLYATLTVDGRDAFEPEDEDDTWVLEQFRRHQTETDKGFGPAAGPWAHEALVETLRKRGYRVDEAQSDWQLPGQREIANALLSGMAQRAAEMSGEEERAKRWRTRRGETTRLLTVGHRDLFALPGSPRS